MIQRIVGVIAAATAIKQFNKKDGTTNEQATLHIQQVCNDAYPQEVAVKVTGPNAQFAKMVGYNVEVDYVVRVFNFKGKDGEAMIGNDIYARSIKVADASVVAAASAVQPSQVAGYLPAPKPVLALPAPAQPAGLLPAPTDVTSLNH